MLLYLVLSVVLFRYCILSVVSFSFVCCLLSFCCVCCYFPSSCLLSCSVTSYTVCYFPLSCLLSCSVTPYCLLFPFVQSVVFPLLHIVCYFPLSSLLSSSVIAFCLIPLCPVCCPVTMWFYTLLLSLILFSHLPSCYPVVPVFTSCCLLLSFIVLLCHIFTFLLLPLPLIDKRYVTKLIPVLCSSVLSCHSHSFSSLFNVTSNSLGLLYKTALCYVPVHHLLSHCHSVPYILLLIFVIIPRSCSSELPCDASHSGPTLDSFIPLSSCSCYVLWKCVFSQEHDSLDVGGKGRRGCAWGEEEKGSKLGREEGG